MAITKFSYEHSSPVPPSRIFKASIVDSHNLIPKLMPQAIKSIDITEGDGGAGSIKQINFAEGSPMKYVKYRVDELDEETLTLKEEEVKAGKEKVLAMYKAMEAYLIQNPNAHV